MVWGDYGENDSKQVGGASKNLREKNEPRKQNESLCE